MLVIFFSLLCLASCSSEDRTQKEINVVDAEVEKLNQQLTKERIKEMNLEMESQPLKFEEWSAYAKTLQKAENEEHKAAQLEGQIEKLKQKQSEMQMKLNQ